MGVYDSPFDISETTVHIGDLTDQEKAALLAKVVPILSEHHRFIRRAKAQVAASLVGAGFCVFGCLWAFSFGGASWPRLVASMSWPAWLYLFGFVGGLLFAFAWGKFRLHNVTMRATERAYLILLFEECANAGMTLSAQDVLDFLRAAPDSATSSDRQARS